VVAPDMGLFATRGAATPPNELVDVNGIVDGAATDAAPRLLVVVKISAPPPPPPLKDGVAAGAGIGAVNPTIANPPPPPPPPLPPPLDGFFFLTVLVMRGAEIRDSTARTTALSSAGSRSVGAISRRAPAGDDTMCIAPILVLSLTSSSSSIPSPRPWPLLLEAISTIDDTDDVCCIDDPPSRLRCDSVLDANLLTGE